MRFFSNKFIFRFLFLFSLTATNYAVSHDTGAIRDPEAYKTLLDQIFRTMRELGSDAHSARSGFVIEYAGRSYSVDKAKFSALLDKLIDDLVADVKKGCTNCGHHHHDHHHHEHDAHEELANELKKRSRAIIGLGYLKKVQGFVGTSLPLMVADYVGEFGYLAAVFRGVFEVMETLSLPFHGLCWLGDGMYFVLDFPVRHLLRARNLSSNTITFSQRAEIYKSFVQSFYRLLFSFTRLNRSMPVVENSKGKKDYLSRDEILNKVEESLHGRGEAVDIFFDALMDRGFFTRPQNWVYGSRFLLSPKIVEGQPADQARTSSFSFEEMLWQWNGGEGLTNELRSLAQIEYSQNQFLLELMRGHIQALYQNKKISFAEAVSARYQTGRLGVAFSKLRFALHAFAVEAPSLDQTTAYEKYIAIRDLKFALMEQLSLFVNASNSSARKAVGLESLRLVDSAFYKTKKKSEAVDTTLGGTCATKIRRISGL